MYGADPCQWCHPWHRPWDFFNRFWRGGVMHQRGFGPAGEGYIRLTAFGDAGDMQEAVERIKRMLDAESRD
ncbi:MAG: hypothetical protein ACLUE1_03690 [Adlercreutzia equolifaciens]